MVDVVNVIVPNIWVRLDNLLDMESSAAFTFAEGVDYKFQNIGNEGIVYKDTAVPPTTQTMGSIMPANKDLLWWYRKGEGTVYVKALSTQSALYIGKRS